MPRFVLMTRLAPESLKDADVRRAMGRAWLKKVQTAYDDFLNLLEEVEP